MSNACAIVMSCHSNSSPQACISALWPTAASTCRNGTSRRERTSGRRWRPAAIASYSAGRLAGARASSIWHAILPEMGMPVIPSTLAVGPIAATLDADAQPTGEAGASLERQFTRFAKDLLWWAAAAGAQRERVTPPY